MAIHPITKARRLMVAALALMALFVATCSTALAATVSNVAEKTGDDGSIVVTVYDANPGNIGTGGSTTVSGAPVEGVGINALRIGSVVELTTIDENNTVATQVAFGLSGEMCGLLRLETGNAIASQDNTYYFAPTKVQAALENAEQADIESHLDRNGAGKATTGSDGVAGFDGLAYGLYLLAKSSLPADATTDLVPFLVSVPMYVEGGQGGDWQSTVYAYPKVRTGEMKIAKTVDDGDGVAYEEGDIYVNAGQTLKYTVTATVPAAATGNGDANGFIIFKIDDTNTGGTLDIDIDSVEVKLGDVPLTMVDQYTASYDGAVLTIELTQNGLDALNADLSQEQALTVAYDATVATDVAFSSKLTNTVALSYQREGTGAPDVSKWDAVDLYTYGIDLTKTLSDGGAIDGDAISFELYSDEGLINKVPVKSGTGGYWVAASDGDPAAVMYVGTDGKLNLYGLEPGTYYLKETATMSGYALLAEPIEIVVSDADGDGTADATVNNGAATVTGGLVKLTVENTKLSAGFTLPQTGGPGTLVATAVGIGLLCAAVVALVVYRKRSKN